MIALIATVFVASLLGSVHCAGMCGAFAACAVAPGSGSDTGRVGAQVAYNVGRLTTYVALGMVAGALGAALDFGGSMIGFQRAATMIAGALMITFGAVALLRLSGVQLPRASGSLVTLRIIRTSFDAALALRPTRRAAIIGLLTTLLPCGWLYAFAITAAGTGGPLWGAVTMAAFWLGTVPMLVAIGTGVHVLSAPLARRAPWVAALAIIGVGLFTVAGRLTVPATRIENTAAAATVEHVRAIDSGKMPCCHPAPEAEAP